MTSHKPPSKSSRSSPKPRRKPGSSERGSSRRGGALGKGKGGFSKELRPPPPPESGGTRHGRPAGVLIGFDSEEDWLDYRLEHHPEFLHRIAEARAAIRKGLGVRLEELED